MENHHLKEAISSWEPLAHHSFQQLLSGKGFVLLTQLDFEDLEHLGVSFDISVDNVLAELADWIHNELGKTSS